jgi:hypothetical protein
MISYEAVCPIVGSAGTTAWAQGPGYGWQTARAVLLTFTRSG